MPIRIGNSAAFKELGEKIFEKPPVTQERVGFLSRAFKGLRNTQESESQTSYPRNNGLENRDYYSRTPAEYQDLHVRKRYHESQEMENKGDQNYISGLFAVNKPSGHLTSASITNRVKYLLSKSPNFAKEWPGGKRRSKKTSYAKLGHGGTLDPLASGIMVLGVNDGTKELSSMLNCSKDYTATVLLGSATDTYDSQGKIVTRAPWEHITPEMIDEALAKFRGPILQKPPIYSACKVDGKKLYEYARYGIPLPRPIEARPVTIFKLEWSGWKNGGEHEYCEPEEADEETKKQAKRVEQLVKESEERAASPAAVAAAESVNETAGEKRTLEESETTDEPSAKKQKDDAGEPAAAASETATTSEETPAPKKPSSAPCFQIHMSCSGGTYVRTIAHDLSLALGSAGHVVQLHRSRQGPFDSSDAIPWEWFDGKNGEGKKWGDEALDKWEEAVVGACRKWREAQDSGGMLNVNPGAAKVGDVADGAAAAPEVPAVASEAPVVSGEQAKPTSPRAQKHLFV
ncbi:hypothetical protein G7K_0024-t1 [Saitoella complicata NRRL Y-17804]|uniref:tRNA pseudouridine(55) synthase n=1 Tax=Saitoella complicata (strain BCRC 22490 / CBS 7301 / JCM 7358 / NBRC 10748 / NRRL Y-17804) TaxID=698492 RepID=A0A0E9N753_SAICN|nr:hypothetical protein G7K_0024-t1 [Saitoella complicata NRRL Y-17804]